MIGQTNKLPKIAIGQVNNNPKMAIGQINNKPKMANGPTKMTGGPTMMPKYLPQVPKVPPHLGPIPVKKMNFFPRIRWMLIKHWKAMKKNPTVKIGLQLKNTTKTTLKLLLESRIWSNKKNPNKNLSLNK